MWIVSLIRKSGKAKRNIIISVVCFVLFVAAVSFDGSDPDIEATGDIVESVTSDQNEETASGVVGDVVNTETAEEKLKREEEAKLKAEAEAAAAKLAAEIEAGKPKLEVLDHKVESDEYTRYVVGTVKNNTKKEYGYVQVEINLYDKDGAQVGSTLANANNLEAGGTWKFKAFVLEENAASYKIKDVTGF